MTGHVRLDWDTPAPADLFDRLDATGDVYGSPMSETTTTQPERREHHHRPGAARMGRSTRFITCPFCGAQVEAYLWSLAGSGKRCPCGVKHTAYGVSIKDRD